MERYLWHYRARIERVIVGAQSFLTLLSDGTRIEWTGRVVWVREGRGGCATIL